MARAGSRRDTRASSSPCARSRRSSAASSSRGYANVSSGASSGPTTRCPLSSTRFANTTGSSTPSPPSRDPRACSATSAATPIASRCRTAASYASMETMLPCATETPRTRTGSRSWSSPSTSFLRRFLLHVLPHGFVRIRHYGLLANRSRRPEQMGWMYHGPEGGARVSLKSSGSKGNHTKTIEISASI